MTLFERLVLRLLIGLCRLALEHELRGWQGALQQGYATHPVWQQIHDGINDAENALIVDAWNEPSTGDF
jgi:hypothetical protein